MKDARTRGRGDDTVITDTSPRPRLSEPLPSARLSQAARRRLTHLLIAKAIFEALFVSAVAVGFYYRTFNPYFRGTLDAADARSVAGWAVDERSPEARVEVQLYIDGRFVGSRAADQWRPDVRAAGRAQDERHGFVFETPALADGEHEARVYAVHESGGGRRRTLQQVGDALRFRTQREGTTEADTAPGGSRP